MTKKSEDFLSRRMLCGALLIVTASLAIWCFVSLAITSIHILFADDQTEYFAQMAELAEESLRRSPPSVRDAESYIEAIRVYYPTGTKQVTGSHLDRLVERARSLAVQGFA